LLYRKESLLRIIIIRHGDPDYEHDSLTPRGDTEAKLLADIIDRYNIDHFYVSPLGRAQRTASFSLEKLGKTATTLDWLKEFPPRILRPDGNGRRMIAWDWRPAD
jgi:probable phosphoglycerate mutase